MKRFLVAPLAVLLLAPAAELSAQANAAPAVAREYRAEFVAELDVRADKYVRLAEAMPERLYTWRPAEGVRSVSEVFLHIAGSNYGLGRMLGAQPPAGFQSQGFETSTTNKAVVVAALRDSFAHLRRAASAMPADPESNVNFRGGQSARAFFLFLNGHLGEHLGQSIAYARMNGVVPPWSGE